jgi:hypothetical protein
MAQKINRIRNLLVANATVLAAVPEDDLHSNHFPKDNQWPIPGVLLQNLTSPIDVETWTQDLIFSTMCYGLSDVLAESLHQIIRTALTGLPEFAIPNASDEATQRPLWIAQGILRVNIETGGQRLVEPNADKRGGEYVLAQYRAEFAES